VETERDLAAAQGYIEQSKLLATDGASATVPFVDHSHQLQLPSHLHRTSTATPRARPRLASDPALRATVDAILLDGDLADPSTTEDTDTSPLKSEGEPSHRSATSTLLKSSETPH
jgi:hypothetical protein